MKPASWQELIWALVIGVLAAFWPMVANPYWLGLGVDTMMWCSDFPHHITDWPHSRYLINSMAQGIDESKKRKIFCENAGKLYGFMG